MSTLQDVHTLVEQRLGLATTPNRRADFEDLLRGLSNGDLETLVAQLRAHNVSAPIWQALVKALAIGETYFFRDHHHFALLREHILPTLIAQRRKSGILSLNITCIGCATGEEPYSVAMLLNEMLPDLERWHVRLVGMDVNGQALAIARQGWYRQWSFRMTDERIYTYFDRVGSGYQLKPTIRERVEFRLANLFDMLPVPQCDLILCRNVLLYFTPQRVADAEALLNDMLYPGGWLMLGPSEALHEPRKGWITHLHPSAPIYQKAQTGDGVAFREHSNPRRGTGVLSPLPILQRSVTQNLPPISYAAAVAAHQREEHDTTDRILAALLRAEPHHAPAHVLLAARYADKRRVDDAHRHLDIALHLEPLSADAYYLRGLLHLEANTPDLARRALRNALYCQRTHALAAYTLGTLLIREGEIARALRLWESAREVIRKRPPDAPLSDISTMTAKQLDTLLRDNLAGWS